MKLKKSLIILLILFVAVCSVSAVSAEDNSTVSSDVTDDAVQHDTGISQDNSVEDSSADDNENSETSNDSAVLKNTMKNTNLKDSYSDDLNVTYVYTYDQLQEALKNGGYIRLTDDINSSRTLNVNVSNTVIDGGKHTINGQKKYRIFNIYASNVTLKNIKLTNGYDDYRGGAVYWDGVNGSLIDCSFINNTANYSSNCYGGAVYWDGVNGSLVNCSFVNNTVSSSSSSSSRSSYGGAVYWNGTNGSLVNCIFVNNTANSSRSGDGGAVYWYGVNGSVVNCSFVGNTVRSGDGGAVFWRYGGVSGSLVNCSFVGNTAHFSGGAVYWYGVNGSLVNCSFVGNTARFSGGAVYWGYGGVSGSLVNCSFVGNTALYGGAVYWNDVNGSLVNCSFVGNTASSNFNDFGGAVYWDGSSGSLVNCSFINNTVHSYYVSGAGHSGITGSFGGAVHWYGVNGSLVNCSFVGNTASSNFNDFGGAVHWNGTNGSLVNCSFVGNTADDYGGAVYLRGGYGSVVDCIFVNNSACYGSAIYNNGINNIENTEILNNTIIKLTETTGSDGFIKFTGGDNLFNGIYTTKNITASNITYNTINGIKTTDSTGTSYSPYNYTLNVNVIVIRDSDNQVIYNNSNDTYNNSKFNVNLNKKDLYSGNYTIFFYYEENYTSINYSGIFNVTTRNIKLRVNTVNVTYGEQHSIYVYVSQDSSSLDITGNVTINVNGTIYNSNLTTDGVSYFRLPSDLKSGTYTVKITYNGDINYNPYNTTVELIVKKSNNLHFDAAINNITYGETEITINITDENITGNVTVTVNSKQYNAVINNGTVSFSIQDTLSTGRYRAYIYYNGNSNYNAKGIYEYFYVNKNVLHFNVDDYDYGSNKFTLISSDYPLTNRVTVLFDGTDSQTVKVNDRNTTVYLDSRLTEGKHNITVIYGGDSNYNSSNTTITFTVIVKEENKIDSKIIFTETADYVIVKITDVNDKPISHAVFNYTINDEEKGNVTTYSDGEYRIFKPSAENICITVNYNGNQTVKASTGSLNITQTIKLNSFVEFTENDNNITIALWDSNYQLIKNGSFSYLINHENQGQHYTDKYGEYVVDTSNITGSFKLFVIYNGNSTVEGTTGILNTVRNNKTVDKIASNIRFTVNGDNINIKITDENNNPIGYAVFSYSVNGINSGNLTTDSNGNYVINTAGIGENVQLTVNYKGNDKIRPSAGSLNITKLYKPVQRIATKIISEDFTQASVDFYNYDERGGYFYVTLQDVDGNPLAGKTVQIGFNGVVYTRTTNSTGGVELQINLRSAGTYTFATAFLGDDNYTGSFVVNKITVIAKQSRIIVTGNNAGKVNQYRTLTVTLQGRYAVNTSQYITAANRTVQVKVNGKTYNVRIGADRKGTLRVRFTKPGTYTIVTSFQGDGVYRKCSQTSKITIRR